MREFRRVENRAQRPPTVYSTDRFPAFFHFAFGVRLGHQCKIRVKTEAQFERRWLEGIVADIDVLMHEALRPQIARF